MIDLSRYYNISHARTQQCNNAWKKYWEIS